MYKQAWRSYLASIHPRNIKKAKEKGYLFTSFFWFFIYPSIIATNQEEEMAEVILMSALRFMPFLMLAWSNGNSPFLMSKALFLAPLKENERRAYVKAGLVIKIGMSVVLSLVIETILSIFYGINIYRICVMVFTHFTLVIAFHISFSQPHGKGKTSSQMHWVNILTIIFAIFGVYACSILDVGAEASLAIFCKVLIGIMVAGYIIFDYIVIRQGFDATVALAGNYELTFRIERKVEKTVNFSVFSK